MNILNEFIASANTFLWSYVLIILLIGLGLYFTFQSKFVQFRMLKEMIRLLGEGVHHTKDGGVSSFQAFCISTASRVGTGNIAGVATAIALGGPGAVFWMWLIALIGSATGFVESTLAQIYKVKDGNAFRGGPAYYMEKALKQRWLGVVFSVLITICFGFIFNSVQSNTIAASFETAFGIDPSVMAIVVALLTAASVFGGVKRLARIVEIIVPIMAIVYILVALFVIIINFQSIPSVFMQIFQNAFGFSEIAGGTLGATMMNGVKRGLFSNEAGMGSAPNAAATSTTSHPVKQGLIQTLSVLIDTLVICSATAFMILFSDIFGTTSEQGIALAQHSLASQVGGWAYTFIAVCIFLFAFSSIVGNYYYGESNIEFLSEKKSILYCYRFGVVGMVVFGALASVQIVWDLADLFMALMAITNLYAITRLCPIAFLALKDYTLQKRAGKDPVFYADSLPNHSDIESWPKNEKEISA